MPTCWAAKQITLVVPPKAAEVVALSNVSALTMQAAESCSICAWLSTPPGRTSLPRAFTWYTRAGGKYSDSKLVATEVFSLGGYDTVRGYDERVVSGDHGWLLVNELRTPRLALGNLTGRPAV